MRYYVQLKPDTKSEKCEPTEVDVTTLPSGSLEVRLRGELVSVDVLSTSPQLSVLVNGQVMDLTLEGNLPNIGVVASGHRSYVNVQSERMKAAEAALKTGGSAADKLVKSQMPGRVIKLMVEKGSKVEIGQSLLIMEAMKMENEMKAKTAGVVAEVFITEGATVEANQKLLRFAE